MARIITPEAILSYPSLFQPRAAEEGGTPKFSATLIFPAGTDVSDLKKQALAVAQERWGDKLKGAKIRTLETQHGPANFLVAGGLRVRLPWRDAPEDVAGKGYPEGSTFVNARSQSKPGVVDGQLNPVTDESRVYPGVIVRASLDFYAYSSSGNNGVAAGLGNIQILRDGDRLDSRVNAADEFDAVAETVADLSDLTGEGETAAVGADDGDDLSDLIG